MDIYTEIILDYYKNPRNEGPLPDATTCAKEDNPLCGDKIRINLKIEKDKKTGKEKISKATFCGKGCAISQASASMLTEKLIGKTPKEIEKITDEDIKKMLNIPISPAREKCAILCLHAAKKALTERGSAKKSAPCPGCKKETASGRPKRI